jgi:thiamine-monophosphate kinase
VNLSDLAAMGATPAWATLALTLPSANAAWLDKFSRGLLDLARAEGVVLVGGDTTRGALTISVQIMGHVARGTALRRGGAVAGDLLVVTGTLGDAGAGLALLQGESSARGSVAGRTLVRRFEYPSARLKLGQALRGIAHAAMDLSDGLVGDLPKLAAASGLSAHVEVERLPVSPALCELYERAPRRDLSLAAGDDYELLIAVPEARLAQLVAAAAECDVSVTIIGNLRPGSGVNWSLDGENWQPDVSGYDHFR